MRNEAQTDNRLIDKTVSNALFKFFNTSLFVLLRLNTYFLEALVIIISAQAQERQKICQKSSRLSAA